MGYDLYHRFQPLIRYQVTDEMTVFVGRCPCGSVFQRIAHPQGRLDDVSVYPDGLCIHPHVFRSVLRQHSAIIEYQVHQEKMARPYSSLSTAPSTGLVVSKLEHALAGVGLVRPLVTLTEVTALDRPGSGKLKRFLPPPRR